MYVPKHFEENELAVLHALIGAHPLATWVTHCAGELVVNHIPFLLDPSRGEFGTLIGHVAKANPVWQSFSSEIHSVCVFQGAETYITPSWYPSKQAHGKAVPTWNYAVVHAHGLPCVIDDRQHLRRHISEFTNQREAEQARPWKLDDAPPEFIEQQLQAIVGIEIPIAKLVGKWKTSQNRPNADKLGVIAGLERRVDTSSKDMALLIKQHVLPGT